VRSADGGQQSGEGADDDGGAEAADPGVGWDNGGFVMRARVGDGGGCAGEDAEGAAGE